MNRNHYLYTKDYDSSIDTFLFNSQYFLSTSLRALAQGSHPFFIKKNMSNLVAIFEPENPC